MSPCLGAGGDAPRPGKCRRAQACGITSGDFSGEPLCLLFPLSRLELYSGRFVIAAEQGRYIAASTCEGHAIRGFRRDVQSEVILEERLGPLLELLLGESGLHFQFEHRSTPSLPIAWRRIYFQCPSAHARVPPIARAICQDSRQYHSGSVSIPPRRFHDLSRLLTVLTTSEQVKG